VLIPVIVTVFEITPVFNANPLTAVKLNASGVVSGSCVMILKLPVTQPAVITIVDVVLKLIGAGSLNLSVCPGISTPPSVLNQPPFNSIDPAHDTLLTTIPVLYHVNVIISDSTNAPFATTPVCVTKLYPSGIASICCQVVVITKLPLTHPTVNVTVLLVL
jgi:hypothetical protein